MLEYQPDTNTAVIQLKKHIIQELLGGRLRIPTRCDREPYRFTRKKQNALYSQKYTNLLRFASIFHILAANRLLRFENSFLSKYRFASLRKIHKILLTCLAFLLYFTFFKLTGSLRFGNNFLTIERDRFSLISKKTSLSKLSVASFRFRCQTHY
jgi:hypothetical protein